MCTCIYSIYVYNGGLPELVQLIRPPGNRKLILISIRLCLARGSCVCT